jgi:rod shape-determining protein MreC
MFVNNRYHNVYAFNTSNKFVAQILGYRNQFDEYIHLKDVNKSLALENAQLKKMVFSGKIPVDSSINSRTDTLYKTRYHVTIAKVINNSTSEKQNYLTINKGILDNVGVDMGVIGPNGVIGKIKSCSDHYSTVYSVLHVGNSISAKIKRTSTEGSLVWDGSDPEMVTLKNIPRHIKVLKNDTILTSSYSDIYPEGIIIGKVVDFKLKGEEAFYRIKVKLSNDFSSLGYVYVVNNILRQEKDSLENLIKKDKDK